MENNDLRSTINEMAAKLIEELKEEELSTSEKLAFLKAILPYSVGKLPNAVLNYEKGANAQIFSARIIEPTKDGGIENRLRGADEAPFSLEETREFIRHIEEEERISHEEAREFIRQLEEGN